MMIRITCGAVASIYAFAMLTMAPIAKPRGLTITPAVVVEDVCDWWDRVDRSDLPTYNSDERIKVALTSYCGMRA